jgi:FtsP/CotA-like multicopper oxidase with cupredoxin domain
MFAVAAIIGLSTASCSKEDDLGQGLRLQNDMPNAGGRVSRYEIHSDGTGPMTSSTLRWGYNVTLNNGEHTFVEVPEGTYRLRVRTVLAGPIPVPIEYDRVQTFTISNGKTTRITFNPGNEAEWKSAQ